MKILWGLKCVFPVFLLASMFPLTAASFLFFNVSSRLQKALHVNTVCIVNNEGLEFPFFSSICSVEYISGFPQWNHAAHGELWYSSPSLRDGWLRWGLNLMLMICWPPEVRPSIEMPALIYVQWVGKKMEPSRLSAKQMLQPCPCKGLMCFTWNKTAEEGHVLRLTSHSSSLSCSVSLALTCFSNLPYTKKPCHDQTTRSRTSTQRLHCCRTAIKVCDEEKGNHPPGS